MLQHKARVVAGRFEHRIFFDHSQAGSYAQEVLFLPLNEAPANGGTRFLSIEVDQGSGPSTYPTNSTRTFSIWPALRPM
ncbi:MAG: hypothetical protein GKR89_00195 [Candidatus Latescibacteria bacterium]|nr:hypothetical protein [Candidatus Latescibacterota bacterium]